jgi:hypothetical protein
VLRLRYSIYTIHSCTLLPPPLLLLLLLLPLLLLMMLVASAGHFVALQKCCKAYAVPLRMVWYCAVDAS